MYVDVVLGIRLGRMFRKLDMLCLLCAMASGNGQREEEAESKRKAEKRGRGWSGFAVEVADGGKRNTQCAGKTKNKGLGLYLSLPRPLASLSLCVCVSLCFFLRTRNTAGAVVRELYDCGCGCGLYLLLEAVAGILKTMDDGLSRPTPHTRAYVGGTGYCSVRHYSTLWTRLQGVFRVVRCIP